MGNWRYTGYYVSEFLGQFDPVDMIALLIMAGLWIWLWRKAKDKTDTFDPSDTLKDPFTNKASAAAIAYMSLLGLSVWYVIREEVNGHDPSTTMLTVMGLFIAKAGSDRAISAWGARKPDMAPPPEIPTGDPVVPPPPDIQIKVDAPAEITTTTKVSGKAAKGG